MTTTTEYKTYINDGSASVLAIEVPVAEVIETITETQVEALTATGAAFEEFCDTLEIPETPKRKVTSEELDACRINGKVGDTNFLSNTRIRECQNESCDGNHGYQESRIEEMRTFLNNLGFIQEPEGYVVWPKLNDSFVHDTILAKVGNNKGRMWAGIKYIKGMRNEYFHLMNLKYRGYQAYDVGDGSGDAYTSDVVCPMCHSSNVTTVFNGSRKTPAIYGWQVRNEVMETYKEWNIDSEDYFVRIDEDWLTMWEQEDKLDTDAYRLEVAGPACTKEARYNKVTQYKMVKHSSEWWAQWRKDREEYNELEEQALAIAALMA